VLSDVSPENYVCNRLTLITYLFGDDLILMQFFFSNDQRSLNFIDRRTTQEMASRHLDIAQYTLVRLALDIWCGGRPRTKAFEISANLVGSQIENLVMVFHLMSVTHGCKCQNCCQRFADIGESTAFANHCDD
jgi:hypothetical protein